MAATTTPEIDPIELVRQLDPDAIRQRIDVIDRERAALMVLLRAAKRVRRDNESREEGAGDA